MAAYFGKFRPELPILTTHPSLTKVDISRNLHKPRMTMTDYATLKE